MINIAILREKKGMKIFNLMEQLVMLQFFLNKF